MRYTREDVSAGERHGIISSARSLQLQLLVVAFHLLAFTIGGISAFKTINVACDSHDSIDECTIDGVHIIGSKYQLNIFAEHPGQVTTVRCTEDGKMRLHTLNGDICRQFPNLKELSLPAANIRRITRGAFVHCDRLETLRLYGNQLHIFPWTAFQARKRAKIAPRDLGYIDLQKNNLTDFKIEKFTKLFPKLFMVNLDENPIDEERMEEISDQLNVLYLDSERNS